MGDVVINHWRTLTYHDSELVLRELRAVEDGMADVLREADEDVRRLRTPGLKKFREWRDAAIFTYGMGLAQSVKMGVATEESSDYDFVTAWTRGDQEFFCPVQLKELVPAD